MAKQQKIDMETDPLYGYVLEQLLKDGLINQQDSVLVVCGGEQDCEVFQSVEFSLVTISNLDERIDGEAYKPYQWSFQDVENLTFEDNSFDIVVVHWGLHHCRSPHQGLLEMYRVCRKGVLLFEPQDTFLTRIGVRLGFGQEYELAAVYDHDYLFGGVRNSEIPNYVYRLNKREIEKTISTYATEFKTDVRCFYRLSIPPMLEWKARLAYQILKLMHPVLNMFANTFTFVNNQFAAYIVKSHQEENIHPWLQESMEGVFSPKKSYFETLYGERYCGKN